MYRIRGPTHLAFEHDMRSFSRWLSAALVAAGGAASLAGAQQAQPPRKDPALTARGVGDTSIFAPFEYPTANEFRSGAGRPGRRYWQNRADYTLHATLDTAAKSLAGSMTLRYTNNSPDTLTYVWMQVEQNAFRGGSLNTLVFAPDSRFGSRDFEGGTVFDRFEQRPTTGATSRAQRGIALKTRVDGTVMRVDLAQPLAPGGSATFDVAWHFLVPEHGADRMGRDGALYELAQWYPRMAVYDDIRGWNTEPYLGQGEFYLDFGDYDLSVTVPAGYIVAATGALVNAAEVLPAAQVRRLAQAVKSDTPIHIVTQAELQSGAARPRKTGMLTWRFRAEERARRRVRREPRLPVGRVGLQGHPRDGLLPAERDRDVEGRGRHVAHVGAGILRAVVPLPLAARLGRRGTDQRDGVSDDRDGEQERRQVRPVQRRHARDRAHVVPDDRRLERARAHVAGRRASTPSSTTSPRRSATPRRGATPTRVAENRRLVEQYMMRDLDEPLEINPDRINPQLLGENAYVKTAVGLALLRDEILGPQVFDEAFRAYTAAWAYKHPAPADFFRTMENASGKRLDWFWRGWFTENPHFDQRVDTVVTRQRGDTLDVAVQFGNAARGVLPIHARFTFTDGTTQTFDYPAEVWSTNTSRYVRRYAFAGKTLAKVELDPELRLVDVEPREQRLDAEVGDVARTAVPRPRTRPRIAAARSPFDRGATAAERR